jgi:hypothetical protein
MVHWWGAGSKKELMGKGWVYEPLDRFGFD